ncbi:MAG TPA: hypothetical protein VFK10_05495 [Burkholderiaceae bacterium]|nr:hypothetical protein [Burkholderiaceae bacterium]
MDGGELLGLPVPTSSATHTDDSPGDAFIVAIDGALVDVNDGPATVDISDSASLQMDGAPSDSALPLTPLWSSGYVDLKGNKYASWVRRNSKAVIIMIRSILMTAESEAWADASPHERAQWARFTAQCFEEVARNGVQIKSIGPYGDMRRPQAPELKVSLGHGHRVGVRIERCRDYSAVEWALIRRPLNRTPQS